MLELFN